MAFENSPFTEVPAAYLLEMYGSLKHAYTTYAMDHKPGLPGSDLMQDTADDYAVMIREEWGGQRLATNCWKCTRQSHQVRAMGVLALHNGCLCRAQDERGPIVGLARTHHRASIYDARYNPR